MCSNAWNGGTCEDFPLIHKKCAVGNALLSYSMLGLEYCSDLTALSWMDQVVWVIWLWVESWVLPRLDEIGWFPMVFYWRIAKIVSPRVNVIDFDPFPSLDLPSSYAWSSHWAMQPWLAIVLCGFIVAASNNTSDGDANITSESNDATTTANLFNQTAAELTGVTFNGPGDLQALISALGLNSSIVLACLVAFAILRLRFPLVYSNRQDDDGVPSTSATSCGKFIDWVKLSIYTTDEDRGPDRNFGNQKWYKWWLQCWGLKC